jgi:peptidoglycan/xylan/chitin deacetylase (PgdA/CDA1 family)
MPLAALARGTEMHTLRSVALYTARALGGFRIAQHLTRNRLRILCYHGFSVGDEYRVQPHMFMRAATFEGRMRILQRRRIPVITLEEAVEKLAAGGILRGETVITIDDGWASTLTIAVPILERYGLAASVYVTTEHLAAGTEVFNVALDYMIRVTPRDRLVLSGVHPDLDGTYDLRKGPTAVHRSLISAAERAFPALRDRQRILPAIAAALAMDLGEVLRGERFRLLTAAQIRELAARGFDVELHTHSHKLPTESFELMAAEVDTNRTELESLLGSKPSHFCFPSGQYSLDQSVWLERLGIASATTCDPGLNPPGSPVMLLRRYLDSDGEADIAFEAEVTGFRELARAVFDILRSRRHRGGGARAIHS